MSWVKQLHFCSVLNSLTTHDSVFVHEISIPFFVQQWELRSVSSFVLRMQVHLKLQEKTTRSRRYRQTAARGWSHCRFGPVLRRLSFPHCVQHESGGPQCRCQHRGAHAKHHQPAHRRDVYGHQAPHRIQHWKRESHKNVLSLIERKKNENNEEHQIFFGCAGENPCMGWCFPGWHIAAVAMAKLQLLYMTTCFVFLFTHQVLHHVNNQFELQSVDNIKKRSFGTTTSLSGSTMDTQDSVHSGQ